MRNKFEVTRKTFRHNSEKIEHVVIYDEDVCDIPDTYLAFLISRDFVYGDGVNIESIQLIYNDIVQWAVQENLNQY